MQLEIMARPAASIAKLGLDAGESITCEVGAMVAMTTGLTVETTTRSKGGKGGIMKGIKRTGYIVAFEDTLQYNVTTLPGLRSRERLKSLFFSGEGLVCRFTGVGRVWVQTRQVAPFLSWVNPFRPAKSNN